MNKKRLLDLAKVIVSLILIVLLLREIGLQETLEKLLQVHPGYLLAALVVALLGVVVRAYRWQVLLSALEVEVPLGQLIALYFIGFLFTNVLPTGFGGDPIRMYELSRYTQRTAESAGTVLADRFFGLIVLQAMAVLALAFGYQLVEPWMIAFTVLLFVGSLVSVWLLLNQRLWQSLGERLKPLASFGQKQGAFPSTGSGHGLSKLEGKAEGIIKGLKRFYESLHGYNVAAVGKTLGVSLIFNISLITMNYLLGLSLGDRVSIWYYFLFVPITSIVTILPVSFAGLGVREGAYVFLFTQAGMPRETALSLSLLVYVISIFTPGLIGGIIYVLKGARDYAEEG
ncbi:MAG: flippase-like domain-containing protein [Anaerolineae bacterium]|nr:flippase-like domain-containing protein [Anaerolineae bacterium]